MMGYATNETKELMPLSHLLANKLSLRLQECRTEKICNWIRPDGKVQVTVQYEQKNNKLVPKRVHTVLISCQHIPSVTQE